MRVYPSRFNLFLLLAALLSLLAGCASWGHKDEPTSALGVFVSVAPGTSGSPGGTETVSVLRSDPVQVTVDKQPILTEQNIVAAKVIDTPDAPAIEIRFDAMGTVVLEQYSATNPGGHFVIFGKWGKDLKNSRWLMAPLITGRMKEGILSFTPDMSRDEANEFVLGLNNVAKTFQTNPTE
ncbi:MAG TPA: hypothetical protein VH280_21760 [Verrucomicrobiae bacterium]|jgi:hypothetical protein|nr:hypothetical protein [Verrucomicrobiae bacterium]